MARTIEPDVQATLSDFLTWTEHFPSHLTRALALIEAETKRADASIASIHATTTTYGALPNLSTLQREDPATLRARSSHDLEELEHAGRMRLVEATRIAEMAEREQARLQSLVLKLKQIPLPSRDPTPDDSLALTSPNLGRTARLAADGSPEKGGRRLQDSIGTKFRARKVTVPGEVLPPPDPNVPLETMSDWSSSRSSPDFDEVMRHKAAVARPRSRTPKPPRPDRGDRSDREKKSHRPRGPRQPGQPGTNAHSAVAGISTSNALLALNPPPPGAAKGSRWLPWLKLTEWEMATLRKRMKKNAIWVPSATMLRRELKDLGRGHSGREEARVAAIAAGLELMDEHNESDPTRVPQALIEESPDVVLSSTLPAEAPVPAYENDVDEAVDAELSNRGMRLNEAKKIKRARLVQEQLEAAAQIEREQANEALLATDVTAETTMPAKKRKRESTPAANISADAQQTPDPLSKAGPPLRRLKISHAASARVSDASDKQPNSRKGTAAASTAARAAERARVATPQPVAVTGTRRLVLKPGKAVSEEPPSRRASLRRSSNVSLPGTAFANVDQRAASRKSKRPAPGLVSAPDDESARVSASRRKAAPRKKANAAVAAKSQNPAAVDGHADEEVIDPNEPRYCICGDVSYGDMIMCDNDNCEKEWFHLDCVKLDSVPPRRTKWYCPDCRKKLKQGLGTNGLVGRLAPVSGNAGR